MRRDDHTSGVESDIRRHSLHIRPRRTSASEECITALRCNGRQHTNITCKSSGGRRRKGEERLAAACRRSRVLATCIRAVLIFVILPLSWDNSPLTEVFGYFLSLCHIKDVVCADLVEELGWWLDPWLDQWALYNGPGDRAVLEMKVVLIASSCCV